MYIKVEEKPVKIEKVVTITLNEEEANVLMAVCGRVGGTDLKHRSTTEHIYQELRNKGFTGNDNGYFKCEGMLVIIKP